MVRVLERPHIGLLDDEESIENRSIVCPLSRRNIPVTVKWRYMYAPPEQLHLNPRSLDYHTFEKLEIIVIILSIPIQFINPMQGEPINLKSIYPAKTLYKIRQLIKGYITFDN